MTWLRGWPDVQWIWTSEEGGAAREVGDLALNPSNALDLALNYVRTTPI